jgi:hypothetical protein
MDCITCLIQFRNKLIEILPIVKTQCGDLFVKNSIIFAFSRFRTNLLDVNQSIIRERTNFDIVEKSPKSLVEIITLV